MNAQRIDELISTGDLSSDWRPSFLAIPRRQFIPDTIWRRDRTRSGPDLVALRRHEQPELWREFAEADDRVITQVDDGHPVGEDAGATVTGAADAPGVVAAMLRHLRVYGGERVLEIGTGTGWIAALLAHRLGADRVTSIEIDTETAARARKSLSDAGYGGVRVVTGEGASGYPQEAPYHRVIATAACSRIPYSWVAQTRTGGHIVAPSCALDYCGLLLALTVVGNGSDNRDDNGTAIGYAIGQASFMRMRNQRLDPRDEVFISTGDEESRASVRETFLRPADVGDDGAVIAIGTRVPRCRMDYLPSPERNSRNGTLRLVDHNSRSCARLYYEEGSPGPYPVHQYGPRNLWDEVEAAHTWWVEHGSPGADRWRFTVTREGQRIDLAG